MSSPPTPDVGGSASLREISRFVQELSDAGWSVVDGLSSVALASPVSTAETLLEQVDTLAPATSDARLIGTFASKELRLRVINNTLLVDRLPTEAPAALFGDKIEVRAAERLWADDVDAAFELPFAWRAEVELDLAKILSNLDPRVDVRVALRRSTVTDLLTQQPYWELERLLSSGLTRRVYMAMDAANDVVHLGRVTLSGPDLDFWALPAATNVAAPLRPDIQLELPDLTSPQDVLPLPGEVLRDGSGWLSVVDHLRTAAAGIAWCQLASEVRVRERTPHLAFRGYRKIVMPLPNAPAESQPVLALHSWVFAEPSPDRLLAVQQVASLQPVSDLPDTVADVRASAEIVYAGLRNDAVAEVVKGFRDAQAATLDTVRQTLKGVQELTKAATDRAFAALIAVGGVLIAKAGANLPDEAGRHLLLVVAGFLALLAAWSAVVEGPLVTVGLRNLKQDLATGSPLLSRDQTDKLADLETVKAARRRASVVRMLIPILHLAVAWAIIAFAIPANY
jgi:hypothetical protein